MSLRNSNYWKSRKIITGSDGWERRRRKKRKSGLQQEENWIKERKKKKEKSERATDRYRGSEREVPPRAWVSSGSCHGNPPCASKHSINSKGGMRVVIVTYDRCWQLLKLGHRQVSPPPPQSLSLNCKQGTEALLYLPMISGNWEADRAYHSLLIRLRTTNYIMIQLSESVRTD